MIARYLTIAFLLFATAIPSRITTAEKQGARDTVSMPVAVESKDEGKLLLDYIRMQCNANQVPVRLVHNIIKIESKWRHPEFGEVVGDAMMESSEGAYGLMQVQLPTAQDILNTDTITADQLMTDNYTNVKAGIKYLAWLRTYYKGNWYFAIAAYNRGILNVNRDIRNGFIPLNDYVYTATTGVFFGKKTTAKMDAELASLRPKEDFPVGVIAEVVKTQVRSTKVVPTVIEAK